MVEKRFNKLGMPDIERFENYLPTAFSSELTLLQKVNKIIQDLIRNSELTNEMVEYLNNFIETFDEKLYQTLDDVFSKWLEDGVLTDLIREVINEEVVEARTDYLGKKYVNLKERLDSEKADVVEATTQLEQIENNKANKVDLEVERERINNLAKLQQGSTTGDAELIDGRVGIDGNTYSNIGEGIRKQIKSVEVASNNKTEYLNETLLNSLGTTIELCTLNIKNGAFITSNGFLTGVGSQTWYKNTNYNCTKGDVFYISLKVPNNTDTQFCICFTNERGKIISNYLPGLSTVTKYVDYKVIAPPGATKLHVQTFLENSEEIIVIKKESFKNINSIIEKINNNLNNSIGISKDICSINVESGAIDVSNNKIIGFGTQTYYKHTTVECSEGDTHYVSLKIPNNIDALFCIAYTNTNNDIILSFLKGESAVRTVSDYKITAPKGAVRLYVQTFIENAKNDTIILKKERQKYISEILDEKRGYFKSRQGEFLNVPSNVLASVKYAYEHGYNWIRVSFCHTSDGVPVLLHDAIINNYARNSDGSELSSSININNITYEEALKYDFGIYAGTQWKGTKITKLEDCIKYCKAVGMRLNIEPKDGDGEKMKKIVDMIYKYCMTDQVCFQIDLWSQKAMLDAIAQYSPYINLMPCGNFGTWIVNQTISNYVNGKREVWIGTYPSDYPSAFTPELYKLCSDNKIKISSPANSVEDLKERFGSCDQVELKNIEHPHRVLKDYVDSIM